MVLSLKIKISLKMYTEITRYLVYIFKQSKLLVILINFNIQWNHL